METLANTELRQRTTRLFKAALALSNISLGQILNDAIRLTSFDLHSEPEANVSSSNGYLLDVSIFGSLDASAHLLIEEESAVRIFERCLPDVDPASSDIKDRLMREGLLTEIANMLVSAFVTEIAEQLQLEIYSNVPHLSCVSDFNEELVFSDKRQLVASIELTGKDSDISMSFLLQFPEVFFTFL